MPLSSLFYFFCFVRHIMPSTTAKAYHKNNHLNPNGHVVFNALDGCEWIYEPSMCNTPCPLAASCLLVSVTVVIYTFLLFSCFFSIQIQWKRHFFAVDYLRFFVSALSQSPHHSLGILRQRCMFVPYEFVVISVTDCPQLDISKIQWYRLHGKVSALDFICFVTSVKPL